MCALQCLFINLRIPVLLIENDSISTHKIQSNSPSSS
eukprot:Gb_15037 [translate_table: standard]